jgi:hypothetical protein
MIHCGAGANFRDDGRTAMRSPYTRRTTIAAGPAQARTGPGQAPRKVPEGTHRAGDVGTAIGVNPRKVGAGDTAMCMTVK